MPENTVLLERPGLYVFNGPKTIHLNLEKDLLVLLHSPTTEMTGIVLHDPEDHLTELFARLEILWKKFHNHAKGSEIVAKIFGLNHGPNTALDSLEIWLQEKQISLAASDTGKGFVRQVTVHCESGKVGVSYSARTANTEESLIASGSARMRNPMEMVHAEVLVLSESTVKRTLAKQAIEEQRNWAASTPKKPSEILAQKKISDFNWSVVLLFDDLKPLEKVGEFIKRVVSIYPGVQFRWVGVELPSFASEFSQLKLLPPLDPILLPEFKRLLQRAVFDHEIQDTTEILNFKKKKKRAR